MIKIKEKPTLSTAAKAAWFAQVGVDQPTTLLAWNTTSHLGIRITLEFCQ
jgi:hypothetical protein